MYPFLDKFFVVFHSSLIVFNLFGWIWKKTRLLNFVTLSLTGLSWTVLGIWYGLGYCLLTDLHWKVLHQLGQHNLPPSYVHYLIQRITGIDLPGRKVDILTGGSFLIAFALSLYLNIKGRIGKFPK